MIVLLVLLTPAEPISRHVLSQRAYATLFMHLKEYIDKILLRKASFLIFKTKQQHPGYLMKKTEQEKPY